MSDEEAQRDAPIDESRVDSLLVEWDQARQNGQERTPEELCPDDLATRKILEARIAVLLRTLGRLGMAHAPTQPGRPGDTLPHPRQGGERPQPLGRFGGYEVIDVLGEGGMGVVYRARQLAPNRLVALKVLRGGALATPAETQRFRAEAEAVALLDHPGIVPVFEAGTHDGQLFLTMKLIDGDNLARRLADYRGDYRAIARLVAMIARAVRHAHERGVLHRDLKPANVLLDRSEIPHVTDFGLAKRLADPEEITRTGSILGTPEYMAPEQASGHRAAITTACDVYSLGAILYALITGRAPFRGANPIETLDRVRNQPPEAPSKEDAGLPRDLETIALKCLEKDPTRRYGSAAALAEDLDRFLQDRPILARPVSRSERFWRLCRRHPLETGLVASLVIASMVAVGALAVGYAREVQNSRRLEASRLETEEWLEETYDAIDSYLQALIQEPRLADPRFATIRGQLLARPRDFFQRQAARGQTLRPDDVSGRTRLVRGLNSLASIERTLGNLDEARVRLELAQQVAVPEGAKIDPEARLGFEVERARALATLAVVQAEGGQGERAEASYRDAIPRLERLTESRPQLLADLALAESNLGNYLTAHNRMAEAEAAFLHAIPHARQGLQHGAGTEGKSPHDGDPRLLEALGNACNSLGVHYQTQRQLREAERYDRESLEVFEALGQRYPDAPRIQGAIARAAMNLGGVLEELGRHDEANQASRRSIEVREAILAQRPDDLVLLREIVQSYANRAVLLVGMKRADEAEALYHRALEELDRLRVKQPTNVNLRLDQLGIQNNLANLLARAGRFAEAEVLRGETVRGWKELAQRNPRVWQAHFELARATYNLGLLRRDQGALESAESTCREAIDSANTAVGLAPENRSVRLQVAQISDAIAELRIKRGDRDEAIALHRTLAARWPGDPDVLYQSARGLAECAAPAGERQGPLVAEAIALLKAAIAHGWDNAAEARMELRETPLGEDPEAQELLNRLLDRKFPDDPFAAP